MVDGWVLGALYFALLFKLAWYSFSASMPPKFEYKLRRHKQRFGKIATTVVLDKDEIFLWSGLQWHQSCHSNEMRPLSILLQQSFSALGTIVSKSFTGAFSSNSRLDVHEVWAESVRALSSYFGMKFLWLEIQYLDVWPLSVENEALLTWNSTS